MSLGHLRFNEKSVRLSRCRFYKANPEIDEVRSAVLEEGKDDLVGHMIVLLSGMKSEAATLSSIV